MKRKTRKLIPLIVALFAAFMIAEVTSCRSMIQGLTDPDHGSANFFWVLVNYIDRGILDRETADDWWQRRANRDGFIPKKFPSEMSLEEARLVKHDFSAVGEYQ